MLARNGRRILTIAGWLILGAAGSGLWELIFRPLFPKIGDLILGITTFGIVRLQDQIYIDVAEGNHERAGAFALFIVAILLMNIATEKMINQFFLEQELSRAEDELDLIERTGQLPERKRPSRPRQRRVRRIISIGMGATTCLFIGVMFFEGSMISYEDTAMARLEQLQQMVAPFVTSEQRVEFTSLAAQMHSRSDYYSLIGRMKGITIEHMLNIPPFL